MNSSAKNPLLLGTSSIIKILLVAALVLGLGWTLVQVAAWKNKKPSGDSSEDGTIILTADKAQIVGPGEAKANFYAGRRNIGWWDLTSQSLKWEVNVQQAGDYRVVLDYALPADKVTDCQLKAPNATLDFQIKTTGGWDKWKTVKPGMLKLRAGNNQVIELKATRIYHPKGIMNFAELRLVPAQ